MGTITRAGWTALVLGGVLAACENREFQTLVPGGTDLRDGGPDVEDRSNRDSGMEPDASDPVACAEPFVLDQGGSCIRWSSPPGSPVCDAASATLLGDGRVLVLGRCEQTNVPIRGAIFDPGTDTWTVLEDAPFVPDGHTAVRLDDGRVLIAGGYQLCVGPSSSSWIFSPISHAFNEVAPLAVARSGHASVLLDDGRVMIIGGATTGGPITETVEVFSAATDEWSMVHAMATPRMAPTASVLPSGEVVVLGGYDESEFGLESIEVFDPSRGSWRSAPPLGLPAVGHSTLVLGDGTLFVSGDFRTEEDPGPGALRSDGALAAWMPLAWVPSNYLPKIPVKLSDDRVLLIGGYSLFGVEQPENWICDFPSEACTHTLPAPWEELESVGLGTAITLPEDRVLVMASRQPVLIFSERR